MIWLLHEDEAQKHLQAQPGDYLGAAQAALADVRARKWAGVETDDLIMRFDTYGKESQMFATVKIIASFDDYGIASVRIGATSVLARAYPEDGLMMAVSVMFDIFYLFFWIFPMYKESKDLHHGMKIAGAWDGFVGYWGLWNFVDWVCITMGAVITSIWAITVMAIQADELQSLLIKPTDG